MDARISMVTLAVADLPRATAFYRDGLGLPLSSASVEGEVAFFRTGATILVLFVATAFAADAGVPIAGNGFRRVALVHNVAEEGQVDELLAAAQEAGGTIVKPAGETFFGRHGYFADTEGHLWEVGWNPGFPLDAEGNMTLPE